MVNARQGFRTECLVLLLALAVLTAVASGRGAEYDEQYTLFLTSGIPRPNWPADIMPAGMVSGLQAGHAGSLQIAQDLRATDVHPPLYFWAAGLWRSVLGGGLFTLRLLSAACALAALALVGRIGRQIGVPPALAMVLTLGCYGFAYTGGIARGFALAQCLTLAGLTCALRPGNGARRDWMAGTLLGGAVLANYLAVFAAGVLVLFCPVASRRHWLVRLTGFLPPVALAGWFFIAQRGTRDGQFPPFEWLPALARLAGYAAASVTGGLALYAPAGARLPIATGLILVLTMLAGLIAARWRSVAARPIRWLLLLAMIAPPLGLLGLGVVFNTTLIELRYLSFATPFLALLVAGAVRGLRLRALVLTVTGAVQAAAIAGLILRPETMQPSRATARSAAALAGDGITLLPRGNDGVGLVGAFMIEAPPDLPVLLVGPDESPDAIRGRAGAFPRVVLALLAQDGASKAEVASMRAAFTHPDWRQAAIGFNVAVYERTEPLQR